jgi:excisionase family DNA binding protein
MSANAEAIAGAGKGMPGAPPILIDIRKVASLLSCSPRHVQRLADMGRMPRPLRLGTLIRWRHSEIDSWIAEGCPSLSTSGGGR